MWRTNPVSLLLARCPPELASMFIWSVRLGADWVGILVQATDPQVAEQIQREMAAVMKK